jgi:pimeloyl-ACP methyl ester carboxylesterase
VTIRKGYSDGPFGQLHWRATGAGSQPDLICLHPAPYSGVAWTGMMPHLAQDRHVIAPDYPGHGGSDPFRHDASVHDYAVAMGTLIDGQADLVGFHTGCLVAVEIARIAPEKARRLVLIDVPAFDAETRAKLVTTSGAPFEITPELTCLTGAWNLGMTKRIESQGLDRSFEMFTEQLRHGRGRNAAFHAGFSYDVETHLAGVSHPTTIIASQSMLLEPARRAANLIPSGKLIERLDITRAVLDEAAETTAQSVLAALA